MSGTYKRGREGPFTNKDWDYLHAAGAITAEEYDAHLKTREFFDAPQEDAAMAAKKRKASGVNIPETQRGTVQVKLRLPPDVAEELDDLAARWGITRSGAVARLLEERAAPTSGDSKGEP